MRPKCLYQTLEDRENPEAVRSDAPYPCYWENTWLGDGYYFWDTFLENAHWWGQQRRFEQKGYLICKAICDFSFDNCFDLTEPEHLTLFREVREYIVEHDKKDATVATVINILRDKTEFSNKYQAIRTNSYHTRKNKDILYFEIDKPSYCDMFPLYQLCIFEKKGLNLRDLQIVYPDKYII